MQGRILLPFALSSLAAGSLPAQAVHVVDQNGGPGTDFTTLQAAIDAAAGGDVVLIRSGVYDEAVQVEAKTLVLQQQAGARARVAQISIRNLALGQSVVIRGLTEHSPPTTVDTSDNEGAIWLEEACVGLVCVQNTVSMSLADCDLAAGVLAESSAVYVYGSRVVGRSGAGLHEGGFGIHATDSFVLLQGSSVQGGAGGECISPLCTCVSPSVGGIGLVACGATEVVLLEASVLGGAGGYCEETDESGIAGADVFNCGGTVFLASESARSLATVSTLRSDEPVHMTYTGQPGDVVRLFLSFKPGPARELFPAVFQHIESPDQSVFLGTAPASGLLEQSFPPVDVSAESLSFYAQALYVNGAAVGTTNPTQLHVLRVRPRVARRPDAPTTTVTRSF